MGTSNHEARRRQERRRLGFRPLRIRLLFVGESPPSSGRFFYQRDSGLYRAMRDTFCIVDPSITDTSFLSAFQTAGCYLIDLCREPVDHLDSRSRRAACLASETSLSRTIGRLRPSRIVTVVRSIEANVSRAAFRAGWHGPFLHLPYPGRWSRHKDRFGKDLVASITEVIAERHHLDLAS